MPAWVNHVKQYASANNVSYGEAMKLAKSSYQEQSGGSLKIILRKAPTQ